MIVPSWRAMDQLSGEAKEAELRAQIAGMSDAALLNRARESTRVMCELLPSSGSLDEVTARAVRQSVRLYSQFPDWLSDLTPSARAKLDKLGKEPDQAEIRPEAAQGR